MPNTGLLFREVGDELLVLDTESDQVHQLNSAATTIWRLYDRGISALEIGKAIASEFDVGEDAAKRDVDETLERLRTIGLVK
jgi:hypothetical protein